MFHAYIFQNDFIELTKLNFFVTLIQWMCIKLYRLTLHSNKKKQILVYFLSFKFKIFTYKMYYIIL